MAGGVGLDPCWLVKPWGYAIHDSLRTGGTICCGFFVVARTLLRKRERARGAWETERRLFTLEAGFSRDSIELEQGKRDPSGEARNVPLP